MKKELIIATRNKGKFAEIAAVLKDLPLKFFRVSHRGLALLEARTILMDDFLEA